MSTALDDTIFDCHVCHDPQNTGNAILRMQEIEAPFTHWFSMQTEGGRALYDDFHKAHPPTEDYGPIPAAMVDKSDPALMARFIQQAGFGDQPNPFPSAEIEAELKAAAPKQPAVNVPMGTSSVWQGIYGNAVNGQFIATPYHDVKVTDPDKLASMSAQYQDFSPPTGSRRCPTSATSSSTTRSAISASRPRSALDGRTILPQMCQECHNSSLDPGGDARSLPRRRARSDEPRRRRISAIQRIKLGDDTRLIMPPTLYRTVTDEEKQAMITELQK